MRKLYLVWLFNIDSDTFYPQLWSDIARIVERIVSYTHLQPLFVKFHLQPSLNIRRQIHIAISTFFFNVLTGIRWYTFDQSSADA